MLMPAPLTGRTLASDSVTTLLSSFVASSTIKRLGARFLSAAVAAALTSFAALGLHTKGDRWRRVRAERHAFSLELNVLR